MTSLLGFALDGRLALNRRNWNKKIAVKRNRRAKKDKNREKEWRSTGPKNKTIFKYKIIIICKFK